MFNEFDEFGNPDDGEKSDSGGEDPNNNDELDDIIEPTNIDDSKKADSVSPEAIGPSLSQALQTFFDTCAAVDTFQANEPFMPELERETSDFFIFQRLAVLGSEFGLFTLPVREQVDARYHWMRNDAEESQNMSAVLEIDRLYAHYLLGIGEHDAAYQLAEDIKNGTTTMNKQRVPRNGGLDPNGDLPEKSEFEERMNTVISIAMGFVTHGMLEMSASLVEEYDLLLYGQSFLLKVGEYFQKQRDPNQILTLIKDVKNLDQTPSIDGDQDMRHVNALRIIDKLKRNLFLANVQLAKQPNTDEEFMAGNNLDSAIDYIQNLDSIQEMYQCFATIIDVFISKKLLDDAKELIEYLVTDSYTNTIEQRHPEIDNSNPSGDRRFRQDIHITRYRRIDLVIEISKKIIGETAFKEELEICLFGTEGVPALLDEILALPDRQKLSFLDELLQLAAKLELWGYVDLIYTRALELMIKASDRDYLTVYYGLALIGKDSEESRKVLSTIEDPRMRANGYLDYALQLQQERQIGDWRTMYEHLRNLDIRMLREELILHLSNFNKSTNSRKPPYALKRQRFLQQVLKDAVVDGDVNTVHEILNGSELPDKEKAREVVLALEIRLGK